MLCYIYHMLCAISLKHDDLDVETLTISSLHTSTLRGEHTGDRLLYGAAC